MTRKQLLSGKLTDPEVKLNLKQLELSALLEVTEAINANLPEEALYRIYHFTLLSNLHLNRLALFVLDEEWECKVKYGCSNNIAVEHFHNENLKFSTIFPASEINGFEEFDVLIPILHKTKSLAYVCVGGVQELDLEETDSVLSFVQTLTSIIIVAIENKKLARRQLQQEALKKELEIAGKVQSNLFPRSLPSTGPVSIKANYFPHLMVGGDYYDYIELEDNKFLVCIADVSGKGIPAALLMSSFQAGLRTLVRRTQDLKDIVKELNFLVKSNAKGERFITFFAGIADLNNRTLRYINAGHNPPILVSGKKIVTLEKGCTVLGAFDKLPFIEEDQVNLSPSSFVFAYTDGVTETVNEEDEEFGQERLLGILKGEESMNMEKLNETVLRELTLFKGSRGFPDDITILSCFFT